MSLCLCGTRRTATCTCKRARGQPSRAHAQQPQPGGLAKPCAQGAAPGPDWTPLDPACAWPPACAPVPGSPADPPPTALGLHAAAARCRAPETSLPAMRGTGRQQLTQRRCSSQQPGPRLIAVGQVLKGEPGAGCALCSKAFLQGLLVSNMQHLPAQGMRGSLHAGAPLSPPPGTGRSSRRRTPAQGGSAGCTPAAPGQASRSSGGQHLTSWLSGTCLKALMSCSLAGRQAAMAPPNSCLGCRASGCPGEAGIACCPGVAPATHSFMQCPILSCFQSPQPNFAWQSQQAPHEAQAAEASSVSKGHLQGVPARQP